MGKEGWMYEKKIRGRWEWGRSGKWGHAEGDESEWTVWTRVWVYVSLPERLSYWTGLTPYQVTHLKLKMLGSEKEEERRHCSLLCNQERVAPFFCPHHPMWANELRWVSGPTGGHTRISAHKSTLPARDALCWDWQTIKGIPVEYDVLWCPLACWE